MKAVVFVLGLVSLFSLGWAQFDVSGGRECTFGPSFWCGSIVNAKSCNALTHCIQTVWEKQNLPEDSDDVCTICKEMVKEARDQLESNETQDEIRQVFEGSCRLVPIAAIRDPCLKLVNQFIPELIETLASQMDPQAVCATAQLCNNPFVDRILKEYEEVHGPVTFAATALKDMGNCQDCKTFIQDIIKAARTHSRADVLNHLLAICSRVSSLSDGCMALVETNFDTIYNFLTKGLQPNDVCDLFGMCGRMYGRNMVTFKKTGDEPCDFCVAIVNNWRNNLIANTTRNEFKTILDGLCHQTRSFEQECLALVDQYFEILYEILVSEIDPKEICKDVGLCGLNSIFNSNAPVWSILQIRPQDHLPLVPLQPSIDRNNIFDYEEEKYDDNIHLPSIPLSRESVSIVIVGETGVLNDVKKSDSCIMCEFVLHFLQNVLNDRPTREEIIHSVENVCHLFPHSISEQCEDYIEAYGDQLIQLLILEIDPATICPMMKLCPGKGLQLGFKQDTPCVLCEFAMTELDEMLKDKSNQAAIKNTVESICNRLPKSIRSECKSFIDSYVDQIVDLIVNDYTPNQICAQLGLCQSKKQNIPELPSPEDAQLPLTRYFIPNMPEKNTGSKKVEKYLQSVDCVLCEFIISKLDALLINDATVDEIEEAMDKVCHLLPTHVMNDCLRFLEDYGKSIIEILVQNIQPSFVCREIRLCSIPRDLGLPKAMVHVYKDKCSFCEKYLDWFDTNAKSKDFYIQRKMILKDYCPSLEGEYQELCRGLTLFYGKFIEKLMQEHLSNHEICQVAKMCPQHKARALLGAEKCTWGPAYWCKSQVHAESCKATKHCEEKVWMGVKPAA